MPRPCVETGSVTVHYGFRVAESSVRLRRVSRSNGRAIQPSRSCHRSMRKSGQLDPHVTRSLMRYLPVVSTRRSPPIRTPFTMGISRNDQAASRTGSLDMNVMKISNERMREGVGKRRNPKHLPTRDEAWSTHTQWGRFHHGLPG